MSKVYHYRSTDFLGAAPKRHNQEASTLRLAPGEWPKEFTVEGIGNGNPFVFLRLASQGNHVYEQDGSGIQIMIFND